MKYILNDGTVAKKGMIVFVLDGSVTGGNNTGVVTKITSLYVDEEDGKGRVMCEYIEDGVNEFLEMIERPNCLRKATKEERLIFKEQSNG